MAQSNSAIMILGNKHWFINHNKLDAQRPNHLNLVAYPWGRQVIGERMAKPARMELFSLFLFFKTIEYRDAMIQTADNGRHPIRAVPGEQKAKPTHFIDEICFAFLILGVLG